MKFGRYIPVGVLYDSFAPRDAQPWMLRFHMDSFPRTSLPSLVDMKTLENLFLSFLKEVSHQRVGSSQVLLSGLGFESVESTEKSLGRMERRGNELILDRFLPAYDPL